MYGYTYIRASLQELPVHSRNRPEAGGAETVSPYSGSGMALWHETVYNDTTSCVSCFLLCVFCVRGEHTDVHVS
jgi:hypothetical protein